MRQFNGEQIHALLDRLFDAALNAEEFEYCCTLLRVRGIMPATWDPLAESYAFTQQLTALINAPLREDLRLGLILLLYCHLTEMDDLYSVPMNLLRVIDGRRYSLAPFESGEGRPLRSPPLKAKRLAGLADRLGFGELGDPYRWMLVKQIRNAFFHSAYSLLTGPFVIHGGEGVAIDNVIDHVVPAGWLLPRLEAGINLGMSLIDALVVRRGAYKMPKTIRATRAGDLVTSP